MFGFSPCAVPWSTIADLIRLRNQTGFFLLVLPTLWALMLASNGRPPVPMILIFIAGAFLMRSAGVTINDFWDRDLDRQVQRTQARPLASGRLHPAAAMLLMLLLIAGAAGLVSMLNPLTRLLALIGLLLAVLYPLAKRVIPAPQAVLGVAFGWGAIMAWAAVRNEIAWPAVNVFLATVCWVIGYDTIYALQDKDDDVRAGVHSTAILFGRWVWLGVLLVLIGMIAILAVLGAELALAQPFYVAILASTAWFGYQAWQLKRGISERKAFALFKQHVWIGSLILSGIWAGIVFK
jgi:4-hydroxybenzoate polyprenyltransferase